MTDASISAVVTLHRGTCAIAYTCEGQEHTAEVFQRFTSKGVDFVYRDHDQILTFDNMPDAIQYLFDQHGIE